MPAPASAKPTKTDRRHRARLERGLRRAYGETAVFSHVGNFTLVHLDSPTPEVIARRVAEFNPNDLIDDDCPLCQMVLTRGGQIVYDERPVELDPDGW